MTRSAAIAAIALLAACAPTEPPAVTDSQPPRSARTVRTVAPPAPRRESGPFVGLIPSDNVDVTAALTEGVTAALADARATGGPVLALRVAARDTHWGSAARSAIRLGASEGAVALITPPERRRAHEISQLGTRLGILVVSTSGAPSVTSTGSRWTIGVEAAAPDASPSAWRATGYEAGRRVLAELRGRR